MFLSATRGEEVLRVEAGSWGAQRAWHAVHLSRITATVNEDGSITESTKTFSFDGQGTPLVAVMIPVIYFKKWLNGEEL